MTERLQRDVLKMLQVELAQAKAGTWALAVNGRGVDVDFVEMLEEAIAEIRSLRARYVEITHGAYQGLYRKFPE